MYAHYWKKGKAGILEITSDQAGQVVIKRLNVLNKKEAKQIAIDLGAKPWNF